MNFRKADSPPEFTVPLGRFSGTCSAPVMVRGETDAQGNKNSGRPRILESQRLSKPFWGMGRREVNDAKRVSGNCRKTVSERAPCPGLQPCLPRPMRLALLFDSLSVHPFHPSPIHPGSTNTHAGARAGGSSLPPS